MTGIEAETRAVIDEARATIEQVRLVGRLAAQANLTHITWANRWGGMAYDDKERTRLTSMDVLRQLGAKDDEINEALQDWHKITRLDYANFILAGRTSTVPEKVMESPALMDEWKLLRMGGVKKIPTSDALRAFLLKAEILDEEKSELLEDYRYYEVNKKHRRPHAWKMLVDGQE